MPPASDARRVTRSAATNRLRAFRGMTPYRQGDLDGFCGLYSAINAVRFSLADVQPLTPSQSETLFHHGVRYLQRHGKLSACARHGLSRPLWRRMVNEIVRKAAKMTSIAIRVERPFAGKSDVTLQAVMAEIEALLDSGAPILTLLDGAYAHYTVLVGHSTTRVSLFDSYGYRWIHRASLDIGHPAAVARHLIDPASLTAVTR